MTQDTLNKIIHSVLFNIFWGAVIYLQVSNLSNKPLLLASAALAFVAIHLFFFATHFMKELLFLIVGFCVGLAVETILSNAGVYQYGLVDTPGINLPPPWMAAMWLMFPPLITYTLGFLKNHPAVGSAFVATSTFFTYYLFGKRMDLIFFNEPLWQGFISFVIFWFLSLRFLLRVKSKLKI